MGNYDTPIYNELMIWYHTDKMQKMYANADTTPIYIQPNVWSRFATKISIFNASVINWLDSAFLKIGL